MKKVLLVHGTVLVLTMIVGAILKGDIDSGIRIVHRSLGMLAALMAIVTLITSFTQQQTNTIKGLSALILLLTLSAAYGGMSIADTTNYTASFNQMTLSALSALIVTVIAIFSLKNQASTEK